MTLKGHGALVERGHSPGARWIAALRSQAFRTVARIPAAHADSTAYLRAVPTRRAWSRTQEMAVGPHWRAFPPSRPHLIHKALNVCDVARCVGHISYVDMDTIL